LDRLAGIQQQRSFAEAEFKAKKKTPRREKFLGRMEEAVPWEKLPAVIEPFYPLDRRGRPSIGLERMLRVYFLQQLYAMADEALEEALYDSQAPRGLLLCEGTLVEASLIAAPSSTKNQDKQRDPEMHQTKKGTEWRFGRKAHIGVDRASGLVHTLVLPAANVADITQTAAQCCTGRRRGCMPTPATWVWKSAGR
jgi:transposase, IS5 family